MRTAVSSCVLALGLCSVSGCTTGDERARLPDATFALDAGPDAGFDAGFPDPVIETCTAESVGATIGEPCDGPADCDDGCYCNGLETCVDAVCVEGADPCVDEVECTADVCLEETDQCFHDPQHEPCGDGDACNGAEICDARMGCRRAPPLYCNDENACTVDSCDMAEGCVHVLRDLDGDGFVDGRCGGEDCDDDPRFGTMIHPGAPEVCDNRRDDNCDGLRDFNDPTCVPTNGTCGTAIALPGPGTYSGSTSTLSADYALGCGATGPDAVFRFNLTEEQDVRVGIAGGGSGAAIALRDLADCAAGPDLKCSAGSPPSILRRSLPAGDYALIVKTPTGAPFDLTLTLGPPTPVPPVDICDPSTLDVSAGGTFSGMFAEVEDDYVPSCHTGGSGYRDAAYRFTLTAPKDVVLSASTTGPSWSPQAYLSLMTDCADPATTVQCVSGPSAELRRRGLPPGTYFVLIESSATDAMTWSLDVGITDPAPRVPGDACSTALDITSATGMVDLATAELDVGTSCGGSSTSDRDVFFYFDLATTRDVTLTTTAPSFHYVSLQTMCGVVGSELRCRSGSPPLVQTWRSLPAGRYFVTASTRSAVGTVSAALTTGPPTPVPPNDRCPGAIEVGSGYSSMDTLIDFDDDIVGCSGTGRPDAFYSITLTARKVVSVIASPVTVTGSIFLTLRDVCGPGANLGCDSGTPAVIDTTLDPGAYTLVVESSSATTTGDFNLRVFITDPP